jgi:RHS repeat-associated protein
VRQESVYDQAGRLVLITETSATRQLLRAEGYVYDSKGRRSHSVDEAGRVTKYEYDNQSRVKTVLYPWNEAKAAQDKKEAEEAGLYFTPDKGSGERYTLTGSEVTALRNVLNLAGPGRGNAVSGSQLIWRESYTYDRNGNRASQSTPWGNIVYAYDAENRLISKGSIQYVYDADGNLLREQGLRKEAEYRYNGWNRLEYATVTDTASRARVESHYRYDGLGRRTLTQNDGGETLRTLYDGRSFEVIREGPSYTDGQLTTRSATGPVQVNTPQTNVAPSNTATGERYRWISDGQEGRTRSTETATQNQAGRYEGINVTLYGKGEAVGLSRSAGTRSGTTYLGKDILESVRSVTGETGNLEERYEYDVFGTPYQGDLENGMNLGYTGKPYDAKTGLYNYGYRDYQPATARFTTVDPTRDGNNWFAYVNNDPVNWRDPWGLSPSDIDLNNVPILEGLGFTLFGPTLSQNNITHLNSLAPIVADKATTMISNLVNNGINIEIVSSFRTIEEQDSLYQIGRDENGNIIPGQNIVTNAKGGESYHNYGKAFDIEIYNVADGKLSKDWDFDGSNWQQTYKEAEKQGFADGRSFNDPVHFEYRR